MKTRMVKMMWAIAFALPLNVLCQHTIHGTIHSSDGQHLPGVRITLTGTYFGAYSGPDGQFTISNVPPNVYELHASLLGYEPLTEQVKVETTDVELKLTMVPSALMIEEVQVSAVRATDKTATTYTNLSTRQIERSNFGQDLPYLMELTPSAVATSDAGAGVGYTGIRIRGVDPTRTNVTVNGIPLNDSESHGVFWVNMPDFASSTDNIQIQRGVGTSSNGAAAFGASINIKTDNIEREAYAVIDNAVGSFNTIRNTVKAGTGLINDRFSLDARLSRITSDGYIDRASSNLTSYYLSGAWVGRNSMLKANVFSGKEVTYQAWWGIPEAKLYGSEQDLITHFYNNYYPGGMYQTAADSANLFSSDPSTYNYYLYRNEEDNYRQDHYQLHYSKTFSSKLALNISGHYTRGRGYYEQYRHNDSLSWYGLEKIILSTDTIYTTDLVRRRWLDNHFYGTVFALQYFNQKNLRLTFGGAANQYLGGHYGEIIWARYASQSEIGQHYYDLDATKNEYSAYLKANYQVARFSFYGDMQVRIIDYSYTGVDQFYTDLVPLKEQLNFTFFNPKAGITYDINERSSVYGSYSMANREPVRDDFIQSSSKSRPKPEQLQNIEAGYRYRARKLFATVNYYLMNYKDQLILTGQINDVGAYSRTNVPSSFRTGFELEAGYLVLKSLSFSGNFTFSQNKIREFDEYVDNYDNYDADGNMIQDVIHHKNTDIAFSPSVIASLGMLYEPVKGLEWSVTMKHVGDQYLDNTSSPDRMLKAYTTVNTSLSYSISRWGIKELRLGVTVNNVLNTLYANNGYTWGYIYGAQRIVENFYFPQAGRNFLLRLSLKF